MIVIWHFVLEIKPPLHHMKISKYLSLRFLSNSFWMAWFAKLVCCNKYARSSLKTAYLVVEIIWSIETIQYFCASWAWSHICIYIESPHNVGVPLPRFPITRILCYIHRAVARSENPGGSYYCGEHKLPPWLR